MFFTDVFGELFSRPTLCRIVRGRGQPGTDCRTRLRWEKRVDDVSHTQHASRLQQLRDPLERGNFPEVGQVVKRVPREYGIRRLPFVLVAQETSTDRLEALLTHRGTIASDGSTAMTRATWGVSA